MRNPTLLSFYLSKGAILTLVIFWSASNYILLAGQQDIEQSLEQLRQHNPVATATFFQAIRRDRNEALPLLKNALNDSDWMVQQSALDGLATLHAPCDEVADTAAQKLNNSNWLIRANAYKYLAEMHCKSAKEAVSKNLLTETDPQVKMVAVDALAMIGDVSHAAQLTEIQNNSHNDLQIRLAATGALAHIGADYDRDLIKFGLANNDANTNMRALAAASQTSEADFKTQIDNLASQKPQLKSMANTSAKSIDLNTTAPTDEQKRTSLLNLVASDDLMTSQWALRKLMKLSPTPDTIEKLRSVAAQDLKSAGNAASTSTKDPNLAAMLQMSGASKHQMITQAFQEWGITLQP